MTFNRQQAYEAYYAMHMFGACVNAMHMFGVCVCVYAMHMCVCVVLT